MPSPNARFLSRQWRRARKLAQWTLAGRLPEELRQRRGFIQARLEYLVDSALVRLGRRLDLRGRLGLPPPLPVPRASKLALPTSDTPVVSVVIPAYGQIGHSLRCLASLAAWPPALPFEVILAEDASGDGRAAELQQVRGLRYVERPSNLGFLRSSNDAMAQARGEYLFLLNNDTEVMPGAIDALAATLRAQPRAGLAGARLLYPDGRLQEAGGIVWRDGSAWNWGNRQDPRRYEFTYRREADYVSGAAIMLPRAAWEAMGGFDEHYLPAYGEDSDLAFRLRAAGYATLYQPRATVIHHEGASHGTDVTQGVKAHQVINQGKFAARWAATLARHEPNGVNILRARDRAPAGGPRRVVLVVDNNIPEPDRDAGSRTMVAFLDALLAQGHAVKFWPLNGLALPGYTEALEDRGIECPVTPWRPRLDAWLAAHGAELDEVILSRPHVAVEVQAALRAHAPQAPVIFYGHDLHHARAEREAAAAPAAGRAALEAEAARLLREECDAWAGSDIVLYPSEDEATEVARLAPGTPASAIVPYALPPAPPLPTLDGRRDVIFVAGFAHPPNVDAAQWLVREIWPLIRSRHPALRLSLVGSKPTPEVRALAAPDIEVTGFVSDEELARRYAAARLALCPLRFGAGIKLKVVEALHQGLPLVTTPVGAQGLPDAPCPQLADAADFASAACALLEDPAAWEALAAKQQAYVEGRFSGEAMAAQLEAAFTRAAARRAAARS
jgi:GT2 family glycosyltransferase